MADNLLQSTFGISKSLLDQVTATASDVKSGVVYIDSDGVIQTGTLSLSGNATRIQRNNSAEEYSYKNVYVWSRIMLGGSFYIRKCPSFLFRDLKV